MLWSIGTTAEFVQLGLAERISWEALLLAAAVTAWRLDRPDWARRLDRRRPGSFRLVYDDRPQSAVGGAGRRHPADRQLAGPGLRPAAAVAVVDRPSRAADEPDARKGPVGRAHGAACPFAFSTLRQLFHGSILTEPGMTEWEDILRSILGILMAIGFLLWGIVRGFARLADRVPGDHDPGGGEGLPLRRLGARRPPSNLVVRGSRSQPYRHRLALQPLSRWRPQPVAQL